MTKQERPQTEAGRRLLGTAYLAGDAESEGVNLRAAILAIEAEGRQQAVREIRERIGPVNYPMRRADHQFVHRVLDGVAGLNTSEADR